MCWLLQRKPKHVHISPIFQELRAYISGIFEKLHHIQCEAYADFSHLCGNVPENVPWFALPPYVWMRSFHTPVYIYIASQDL